MVNLHIQQVNLSQLTHDPANARIHKKRSLEALKTSLLTFGQRKPIVATQEFVVIAGNGTLEAARELGWDQLSVALLPPDWSNEQIRAYALADNSVAALSSWDEELLKGSLESLDGSDFDLEMMGLPRLMEDLPSLEEVQDFIVDSVEVKPGQLWQLGHHRLLCGDSTKAESFDLLMNHQLADCVWTDPPYGVDLQRLNVSIPQRARKTASPIQNDELQGIQLEKFLHTVFTLAISKTRPGAAWYVASASGHPMLMSFLNVLTQLKIWRHTLVWAKDRMIMGRSDYHYQHEFILYGWTPGSHSWQGDRKQTSLFNVTRPSRSEEHPTMKPVELVAQMLRNSTQEHEVVLDPFAGSGSTLLAAEQLNRKAMLIEIEPQYCQVIITRWQNLTGEKAVLLDSKES